MLVLYRLISVWLEQAAPPNSRYSYHHCSVLWYGPACSLLLDRHTVRQHYLAASSAGQLDKTLLELEIEKRVRETYTCERVLKGSHSSSRCSSGYDRTFARSVCTGCVSCSCVFLQAQSGQSLCGITAYGLYISFLRKTAHRRILFPFQPFPW